MTQEQDPFCEEDDRRIGAVLHTLAHAEPSETLQARLVATLRTADTHERQRDAAQLHWMPPFASSSWLKSRLALAACLLAIAGAYLHHAVLHGGLPPATQTAGPYAFVASGRIGNQGAYGTVPGRTVAPLHGERAAASLPMPKFQPSASGAPMRSPRASANTRDGDRTGPQEVGSVSFPSPPLPLTEQERLLLRLGRHEPAEQLALLTLPARNAAFQHEKDAVAEFFAPAPPLRGQMEPDEPAGQP